MPMRPALDLAFELARAPMLVPALRRQAVAADVLDLIRIAADCPETCRAAADRTGRPIAEIKLAAQHYLQQVVLFPTSDSYRTLGLSPGAPRHVMRAHMAWLLKWLHPDHAPPEWAAPYYARVMSAWQSLEVRARRRECLDGRRRGRRPGSGAAARTNKIAVHRTRALDRPPAPAGAAPAHGARRGPAPPRLPHRAHLPGGPRPALALLSRHSPPVARTVTRNPPRARPTGPCRRPFAGPGRGRSRPAAAHRRVGRPEVSPASGHVLAQRRTFRWAVRIAAFAAAAVLGWRIVVFGIADHLAVSDPEQALAWEPDHAAALLALAQRQLGPAKTDLELDEVGDLARRALGADPLDGRALSVLGTVAERRGNAPWAEALMRAAAARSPRDLAAQLWLANAALRTGDVASALARFDNILKVKPALAAGLLPSLASLADTPAAVDPLAGFLGSGPAWRPAMLEAVTRRAGSLPGVRRLFGLLQAGPLPPTTAETGAYLQRLLRDGLYEAAYLAFLESLPPAGRASPGYLRDGDFAAPSQGIPFDWLLVPTAGVRTAIVPPSPAMPRGRLRVEFSGSRVAFGNVSQLLLLPPGRYRLTGEVEAVDLRTTRGVWWRLSCADHPETQLGTSDLAVGTFARRQFSFGFDVPESSCRAQRLVLELPARVASESQISGRVEYGAMRIERVQGATALSP